MKILSFIQLTTMVIFGITLTNCNSDSKCIKAGILSNQNTQNAISKHEDEIATAGKTTYSAFQKFLKEANIILNRNDLRILRLKLSSSIKNNNLVDENQTVKISDIKKRNAFLKMKLDNYEKTGEGNWMLFKAEFDSDIDSLLIAYNDVTHKIIQ